jgi:hypothetical protein
MNYYDKYDKASVLKMINQENVSALMKIYGITYQHLANRLRFTKQNVMYLLKAGTMKEYQKEIILEIFISHGLEITELMFINHLTSKSKILNKDVN